MAKVVAAMRASLRRGGASEGYVEKVLADLGLDAPREANGKRKPVARTVQSEDGVVAARPGVYRVVGVSRLYLKKTTKVTGSYFVRWRFRKGSQEETAALATARAAGRDKPRLRSEIGLGSIINITLADAIARAKDIDAGLRNGTDPRDVRAGYAAKVAAEAERAKFEAAKPTVAAMTDRYVAWMTSASNKHPWKGRYAVGNWLNPLKTHAFPAIGALKINEVTPENVATVLAAIRSQGLADRRVRSSLRSLFTWLIESGIRDSKLGNPVSMIGSGKRKVEHFERVEPAKAPAVFQQLYERTAMAAGPRPSDRTAIACWTWMILTAVRPNEARGTRWSEIDLDRKLWTIPGSRMKAGKEHTVPLQDTAVAILEQAREQRTGDFVFAGRNGGSLAQSTFADAPKRAGIDAATAHGWRSVCSDALSEHCHISREVREAVLAHTVGGVEGAYRRGDALAARTVAMQRYEQWLLTGQEQGSNVVSLDTKRA
jgi:integrase